jgi:protein SCO1
MMGRRTRTHLGRTWLCACRAALTSCSLAALLGAAPAGGGVGGAGALKAGVFDPPRQAPDFTLQGTDGRQVSMSHFRGKVVLLAFGFTSCPAVCPTTLATLAQARRELGDAAADVQVLYVTVDPQRDIPQRLRKYLAVFDPTFIGGTGTEAQLSEVRKQYGVSAEKKPYGNDYTYVHSSFIYLIDRKGLLRALMPYGHSPEDFSHDVTILLKE